MKHLFMLACFLLTSNLVHGEVPTVTLNDKKVRINTDQVKIIRTSETPDKVRILLNVPAKSNACVAYGTRVVYGQNYQCGTETFYTQSCSRQCRPARPPRPGENVPVPTICENVCTPVAHTRYRFCHYNESYCASYGTVVNMIEDQVTIKFKTPSPAANETEEYLLSGSQNHYGLYNIGFRLEAVQTIQNVDINVVDILGIGDIITVR